MIEKPELSSPDWEERNPTYDEPIFIALRQAWYVVTPEELRFFLHGITQRRKKVIAQILNWMQKPITDVAVEEERLLMEQAPQKWDLPLFLLGRHSEIHTSSPSIRRTAIMARELIESDLFRLLEKYSSKPEKIGQAIRVIRSQDWGNLLSINDAELGEQVITQLVGMAKEDIVWAQAMATEIMRNLPEE